MDFNKLNDIGFDFEFYKNMYHDLSHMDEQRLKMHFIFHGYNEGRICSNKYAKIFVEDKNLDIEAYKNKNINHNLYF
jgi:hypothetical protein